MTGEGWRLERGATVLADGTVHFAVWAPSAERVQVAIVSGPGTGEYPLHHVGGGVFAGVVAPARVGSDYYYRLDGDRGRPDPASRHQPAGVHGPSRVVDPAAFRWSDTDWRGLGEQPLAFYELHVGTFTGGGTFDAAVERLPYLRDLGITAIELMPVAEFPGGRNWGYDGVALYAPQSSYGGPEGLRRLVNAAHAAGLGVVLDVVYNHLGPEGNYLGDFGPYFTDRYRTPWGFALNLDGPDSDEVRRYLIDNARYWVSEYRVDGLRLDAVHAILDFTARHVLEELTHAVHVLAEELGRRVLVIAESDLNDPRLVRRPARGGYGLDAQWSDDFHHAVHATLTGERMGYYADFGGLGPVEKVLRDRFVLDGRRSVYRSRRHGAPAGDVPADRFVVFIQNHDQVGNRVRGERLASLVPFEAQKVAAALLLLSPYVPLVFMGEEYGETNPFLYFVSHSDPALVEAVRDGRRREFAAFGWEGDLPDPQAEETFCRSRLTWDRVAEGHHAQLVALYRELLHLRRETPALHPGAADVSVTGAPDAGWLTLRLEGRRGPPVVAAFNLAASPAEVPLPDYDGEAWVVRFSTEDPAYGGAGRVAGRLRADRDGALPRFLLPPLSAALLELEGG